MTVIAKHRLVLRLRVRKLETYQGKQIERMANLKAIREEASRRSDEETTLVLSREIEIITLRLQILDRNLAVARCALDINMPACPGS